MVDIQTFTYAMLFYGFICSVLTWSACVMYHEDMAEQDRERRIARRMKREQTHEQWRKCGLVR